MTLPNPAVVYLAADGFTGDLLQELALRGQQVVHVRERLVFATLNPEQKNHPVWAQNTWENPCWIPIQSIGEGVRKLKALQRNWHCHPVAHHRRAALITEKLPHVSSKPLVFGFGVPALPEAPLGSWTLWEKDLILASPRCSSPFRDGVPLFQEDKLPPSRAYLKLWEAFTLTGTAPHPGDLCFDLGACPGGWTWVIAHLGAKVFSLDRAPLDPRLSHHPLVHDCKGSGFGLDPQDVGEADWLFSDMICYPERLLVLVERWLEHKAFKRAVCTLKFQGETDHATAEKFAAIPGSRLMHLGVNRHELTWVLV